MSVMSEEYRLLRAWRPADDTPAVAEPEVGDEHDQVGSQEIVEPPPAAEDQQQAHGGDDQAQEVADAPEREEAASQEQSATGKEEDAQESSSQQQSEPQAAGGSPDEEGTESESDSSSSQDETEPTTTAEEEGEEDSKAEETGGDAEEEGQRNAQEAFTLDAQIERARLRRLQTAFASVVGKVAEDLAGFPVDGDDEWHVEALMMRRFTHRPLSSCRQSREKERVIIVLDTSGSCAEQADFFARISGLAARQNDVEIFAAPNAQITAQFDARLGWVYPHAGWESWRGRTVIFFGDFDGGDAIVKASRENKLYWFSCEDRYSDMTQHSWCSYSLDDFRRGRGKYLRCRDEDEFMQCVRKVR